MTSSCFKFLAAYMCKATVPCHYPGLVCPLPLCAYFAIAVRMGCVLWAQERTRIGLSRGLVRSAVEQHSSSSVLECGGGRRIPACVRDMLGETNCEEQYPYMCLSRNKRHERQHRQLLTLGIGPAPMAASLFFQRCGTSYCRPVCTETRARPQDANLQYDLAHLCAVVRTSCSKCCAARSERGCSRGACENWLFFARCCKRHDNSNEQSGGSKEQHRLQKFAQLLVSLQQPRIISD